MKLTCIIVDDEFLARQLLEGYIHKVPYLELVALCESAIEANEILHNNKIDLVFLDVNMPELSGINFLKSLKHKPEVILTTAYSEHALEGYRLDVIEYLLKPIYFERFLQAVNKAKDLIDLKTKASTPDRIPSDGITKLDADSIFIKTGTQKINRVSLPDILYIESMHEYIRINLKDEGYTIHHSLKNILEILPTDIFVQIHRSFIINLNQITEIEGNVVKLGDVELSIGKNFREDFIDKIKSRSIGMRSSKGERKKE